jgi:hypothetical protein
VEKNSIVSDLLYYSATPLLFYSTHFSLRANMANVQATPARKPANAASQTLGSSCCVIWAMISFMAVSFRVQGTSNDIVPSALRQALHELAIFGVQIAVGLAGDVGERIAVVAAGVDRVQVPDQWLTVSAVLRVH